MTSETGSKRVAPALAAAVVALGLVVVSCESPAPTEGDQAAATSGPPASAVSAESDDATSGSRFGGIGGATLTSPSGDSPLVLVDGEVREEPGSLQGLEPKDISRIEVIKGGAADRLYGERGAHGVILITTKEAAAAEEGSHSGRASADAREEEAPAPSKSASATGGAKPTAIPYDTPPRILNVKEVQEVLRRAYPADLREAGEGGRTVLWLHIDRSGRVAEVRVKDTSGRDVLDRAATEVARSMEFAPAENDGEATPVWVAQPITFEVSGS